MDISEKEQIVFTIISSSGSARSHVFEAMKEAEKSNFDRMHELLKLADNELKEAHNIQTQIIQAEAKGNKWDVDLLMIHAQDHLMTSMLARDFTEKMAYLYKELSRVNKLIKKDQVD